MSWRRRGNIPGDRACRTPGCVYLAEEDRDYCCNGCKYGGRHTRNCSRHQALPTDLADQVHPNSSNEANQTLTFTPFSGIAYRLSNREDNRSPGDDVCFRVPDAWARRMDITVREYLHWFTTNYQTIYTDKAVEEWEQIAQIWDAIRPLGRRGPLQEIHAFPREARPDGVQFIDVDTGIQTTARGVGNLHDLTGCDFEVMAELAGQESTAIALRLAMLQVEMQGLSEIAFTCQFGKHRSPACVCLLAMIFYPQANLVFHTRRMTAAARQKLDAVSMLN